jgi:hypothetical protein
MHGSSHRQNGFRQNGARGAILALALIATAPAFAASSADPYADGKTILNLRYRFETVDQSNIGQTADAHTLRVRAGYRTRSYSGVYFLGEVEGLLDVAGDYNNTDNGNVGFPVVADPDGGEINQAFVGYRMDESLDMRLGLQRINIGNQRFIGAVGFRQREQTYLAFTGTYSTDAVTLRFGQIDRAQRIFGADHSVDALAETDLNAQILDATFKVGAVNVQGYYYAIGNDDTPAASHTNIGVSLTGRYGSDEQYFSWRAEFAQQNDFRGGAPTIDADYSHLVGGYHVNGWDFGIAQEILGGDGTYAFQTPLATGHAFNGWADQFLATPASGLRDLYLSAGTKFGQVGARLVYHDFEADNGGGDLGDELDLVFSYPLPRGVKLTVIFADYSGTATRPDSTKFWISLGYVL